MKKIEEIIVVEGRDDTAAVRRAVDAVTIETHGYGIRGETWEMIETAYKSRGIIVFTDPDTAGEQIRRRILERFPGAKEAFLDQSEAEKDGDIGIENASPESIIRALEKAHAPVSEGSLKPGENAPDSAEENGTSRQDVFTPEDMFRWGLDGMPGAAKRRRAAGAALGIGQATGKTFLRRINRFGITRSQVEEALRKLEEEG